MMWKSLQARGLVCLLSLLALGSISTPVGATDAEVLRREHLQFYRSGDRLDVSELLDLRARAGERVVRVSVGYNMIRSQLEAEWIVNGTVGGHSPLEQGLQRQADFTLDVVLPASLEVHFVGPPGQVQVVWIEALVAGEAVTELELGIAEPDLEVFEPEIEVLEPAFEEWPQYEWPCTREESSQESTVTLTAVRYRKVGRDVTMGIRIRSCGTFEKMRAPRQLWVWSILPDGTAVQSWEVPVKIRTDEGRTFTSNKVLPASGGWISATWENPALLGYVGKLQIYSGREYGYSDGQSVPGFMDPDHQESLVREVPLTHRHWPPNPRFSTWSVGEMEVERLELRHSLVVRGKDLPEEFLQEFSGLRNHPGVVLRLRSGCGTDPGATVSLPLVAMSENQIEAGIPLCGIPGPLVLHIYYSGGRAFEFEVTPSLEISRPPIIEGSAPAGAPGRGFLIFGFFSAYDPASFEMTLGGEEVSCRFQPGAPRPWTSYQCEVPDAASPGSHLLQVANPYGSASRDFEVYLEEPKLRHVMPSTGVRAGEEVTVTGHNFDSRPGMTRVFLGENEAEVLGVERGLTFETGVASSLRFVVPEVAPAGHTVISVETEWGVASVAYRVLE